uniref:50S ribosomal protein L31 n=1 Tax=Nitzschia sp. (in: diatoms) TaxID=1884248 RepID=A0A5J6DUQ6_9STRA|nr:ribosomal protein L31 [Nitzschia sp. (in: diatoms)]
MIKKKHIKWISNSIVIFNGKILCLIGSTKSKLKIDICLLNHPFYSKNQSISDSEGRIEKFMKKYKLTNN